jgi:hypothetical protein
MGSKLFVNQDGAASNAVLGALDASVCGTFCMMLGGWGHVLWSGAVGWVLCCYSLAVALDSVDVCCGELIGIASRKLSDRLFDKFELEGSLGSQTELAVRFIYGDGTGLGRTMPLDWKTGISLF